MTKMTVNLRSIPGTHAAIGWAEGHTIVVDRPDGRAGGMGLGFNGGQLLALAIGGCLCNDLQYVAHDMGVSLTSVEVEVTITLEGNPAIATHAKTRVAVTTADLSREAASIIRRAQEICGTSHVALESRRGLRAISTHCVHCCVRTQGSNDGQACRRTVP